MKQTVSKLQIQYAQCGDFVSFFPRDCTNVCIIEALHRQLWAVHTKHDNYNDNCKYVVLT